MSDSASDEQQPLMWIGQRAIHASLFVVLVYVASLLTTSLLMWLRVLAPLAWLDFDSTAVLHGQAWRLVTYGLHNPPSLWFVVDMFMIAWFGRELERFFGRRFFLVLFGCLYLLSPLLFTALGTWMPFYLVGETGAFAVFIAFATLYPDVVLLFNVLAKWVAAILVAIYTLIHLAYHDTPGLLSLWATSGFAFGFVRYQQGRFSLPSFRIRTPRPAATRRPGKPEPVKDATMDEMNSLLDKIAESGISSLTPAERAKLDAGSATIVKRKNP